MMWGNCPSPRKPQARRTENRYVAGKMCGGVKTETRERKGVKSALGWEHIDLVGESDSKGCGETFSLQGQAKKGLGKIILAARRRKVGQGGGRSWNNASFNVVFALILTRKCSPNRR